MKSVKLKSILLMTAMGLGVCNAMESDGCLFDDDYINGLAWGMPNQDVDNEIDGMMDLEQLDIDPVVISIGTTTREVQKAEENKKAETHFRAIYFSENAEKGLVELQKKILQKLEGDGYTLNYVDGCTEDGLYEKTIEFQGKTINVGISTRKNKDNNLEIKKFHSSLDVLKDLENNTVCDGVELKIMQDWIISLLMDGIKLKEVRLFNSFIAVELFKGENSVFSELFDASLSAQKTHISLFKIKTVEEGIQEKLDPFMADIENLAYKGEMKLGIRDTKIPSCFLDVYEKITGSRNLPNNYDQSKLLIKLKECTVKSPISKIRLYTEIFRNMVSSLYNTKRQIVSYDSVNTQLDDIYLEPKVLAWVNQSNGPVQSVSSDQSALLTNGNATIIADALTVEEVKTLLKQNTSLEQLKQVTYDDVIEEAKKQLKEEEELMNLISMSPVSVNNTKSGYSK